MGCFWDFFVHRFLFSRFLVVYLGLSSLVFADDISWFTGSFLATNPVNMLPGEYTLQPYLIESYTYAAYSKNWGYTSATPLQTFTPAVQFEFGLLNWLDFTIYTQAQYNAGAGQSDFHLGITQAFLGFQILKQTATNSFPNLRLLFVEQFPTGPYQNLSPEKSFVGAGSNGSFQSGIILVLQSLFSTVRHQDLNINLNLDYFFYLSSVHVHGYNYYGGNASTNGFAQPGEAFTLNLAVQFAFTENWAIVSDFNYQHTRATTFFGNAGDGISSLSAPASQSIVITPGFEYNMSANLGLLVSTWLTVAGQNTSAFAGGVISFDATF